MFFSIWKENAKRWAEARKAKRTAQQTNERRQKEFRRFLDQLGNNTSPMGGKPSNYICHARLLDLTTYLFPQKPPVSRSNGCSKRSYDSKSRHHSMRSEETRLAARRRRLADRPSIGRARRSMGTLVGAGRATVVGAAGAAHLSTKSRGRSTTTTNPDVGPIEARSRLKARRRGDRVGGSTVIRA